MRRLKRERVLRWGATLAVALGAIVLLGLVTGFDAGLLSPIAIGVAMALAFAGERGRGCTPLFRRRD